MAYAILISGLIFIIGLFVSKLLERLKFPAVTAYLITGVIIGPYVFNIVPKVLIHSTDVVANVILSMVAFSLGQTFSKKQLSRIGSSVMLLSWGEVLGAFVLVTTALYFAGMPLYQAILYGGIAPATAPAATVMVIREYRAKGIFTETLLGIVAIDDAWGIIVFALGESVAKVLVIPGTTGNMVFRHFLLAAGNVLIALGIGGILGLLLSLISKHIKSETNILIAVFGFILLTSGIAIKLNVSDLLANMAQGAVLMNMRENSTPYFDALKKIDWLFYLYFFVLTGCGLELPLLKKIGVMGLIYLITRPTGEYVGAFMGAVVGKMEKRVRNLMGLGLVPQAGVALGLAILVRNEFRATIGHTFLTTIVATTIIYEILGPFFTKYALKKAGEIQ